MKLDELLMSGSKMETIVLAAQKKQRSTGKHMGIE